MKNCRERYVKWHLDQFKCLPREDEENDSLWMAWYNAWYDSWLCGMDHTLNTMKRFQQST